MNLPNDHDRIYIICYPAGAGGNFLANCLALSDDCVFSDAVLARLQLAKKFTIDNKIQYLKDKLQQSRDNKIWNDLALGNGQLFGVPDTDWTSTFPQLLGTKLDTVVAKLIQQRKKFFFVCHNIISLEILKKIWPNSKIIIFVQYRNFLTNRYVQKYHPQLISYWNTVRGQDWPTLPPRDHDEFRQLSSNIQTELIDQFDFEIKRWFNYDKQYDILWQTTAMEYQKTYTSDVFLWNVDNNYFSSEQLLAGLNNLGNCLDLHLVDPAYIRQYFDEWEHTLKEIKIGKRQI
jgi:hypothetical protein